MGWSVKPEESMVVVSFIDYLTGRPVASCRGTYTSLGIAGLQYDLSSAIKKLPSRCQGHFLNQNRNRLMSKRTGERLVGQPLASCLAYTWYGAYHCAAETVGEAVRSDLWRYCKHRMLISGSGYGRYKCRN